MLTVTLTAQDSFPRLPAPTAPRQESQARSVTRGSAVEGRSATPPIRGPERAPGPPSRGALMPSSQLHEQFGIETRVQLLGVAPLIGEDVGLANRIVRGVVRVPVNP